MSFDPFGDFKTAGYLRNVHRLTDLELVKRLEHASFEANVEQALACLSDLETVDYKAVLRVHEILFLDVYPWAGKDRLQVVPHLRVTKGEAGSPSSTEFADPLDIRMAAEHGIELACKHERFRQRPGEVMGLLALAHPFLDGNGRTILLVYLELCHRAGFAIDWSRTTKSGYLQALSAEIQEPRERPLDAYLLPCVVGAVSREDWPSLIGDIKGLDGLDKDDIAYEQLDRTKAPRHYRSYLAQPPDDSAK